MFRRLACLACLVLAGMRVEAQLPPVPDSKHVPNSRNPALYVAQRRLELGRMIEGDKKEVRWLIENRGAADLVIDETKATCGCTIVNLSDEQKTIPPGGQLSLRAVFDSTGRTGPQTKGVTVYSNDLAEPKLTLHFTVDVQALYDVKPKGLVNLRSVQRGQPIRTTIDFLPGPDRGRLEILDISLPNLSPVALAQEPYSANGRSGTRLRISVDDDVALGKLSTKADIKLRIGEIERTREITIRGDVVGDLTWQPAIVDNTRQRSRPGKRFAPVRIRSAAKTKFEILSADAGPYLDVKVETGKGGPRGSHYAIHLTLREDVEPGPFGTTLVVRTSAFAQPLIRVPVFGVVAEPILVDPPLILLRQDGTPKGTHRRMRFQASAREELHIEQISCDLDAVTATIDREASARYRHVRWVDIALVKNLPKGRHEAMLNVTTGIKGAERLAIPIFIEVP